MLIYSSSFWLASSSFNSPLLTISISFPHGSYSTIISSSTSSSFSLLTGSFALKSFIIFGSSYLSFFSEVLTLLFYLFGLLLFIRCFFRHTKSLICVKLIHYKWHLVLLTLFFLILLWQTFFRFFLLLKLIFLLFSSACCSPRKIWFGKVSGWFVTPTFWRLCRFLCHVYWSLTNL